ncbi:hypothetical protein Tsubulata_036226 [Turnera subulata]|uniref:Cystatin domain-containing protein n=1 Tax=Turnera subulata TaxID=218843 RepID=A0A9Q0G9M3_9ROSI|nr:hypothetical protein Tsubulata_036226 [Turnera subulata]
MAAKGSRRGNLMGKPVLAILLFLSFCMSVVSGYGRLVGQRTEVRNVQRDEEVQELGRFSVHEFNKQLQQHGNKGTGGDGGLEFSRVVAAEKQVVSGIKYYLRVEVTTKVGGETKMFDSVVVVKPWLQSKKLLNFQPSTELWVRK